MGAGHYIKSMGITVLKVLIGLNNGEYQSIDLSTWLTHNPKDILKGNFGVSDELVDKFPKETKFFTNR